MLSNKKMCSTLTRILYDAIPIHGEGANNTWETKFDVHRMAMPFLIYLFQVWKKNLFEMWLYTFLHDFMPVYRLRPLANNSVTKFLNLNTIKFLGCKSIAISAGVDRAQFWCQRQGLKIFSDYSNFQTFEIYLTRPFRQVCSLMQSL